MSPPTCGVFLDVGMYVPSRIFQASQQSVKLLSSPNQHDLDGKVSSVSPRLNYLSATPRVSLQDCKGKSYCLMGGYMHGSIWCRVLVVLISSTGFPSPRAIHPMQR